MSVLLDTGFLYAFLNRDDPDHAAAYALGGELARRTWGTVAVSDWVVCELLNLVRAKRLRPEVEGSALALLPLPRSAFPGLRLLSTAPQMLEAIAAAYAKHRDRRLSFTDASLLVALEEHGIDRLATFDRGLRGLCPVLPLESRRQ